MLCFRCGSPVSDGAVVCDNCGQDLGGSSEGSGDKFKVLQRRLRQTSRQLFEAAAYQVGELVADRYEITDVVGTGALGMVYKALDQEEEVEVAVKVLSGEYLPDEGSRKHFLTSLQRVRDLVHENVVKYLDVDRDGDRCFYVMQFLEGLTLRKIIDLRSSKGQTFSLNEVEPICNQLCEALGNTAWQIVHGGMKPENVIILPDLLKVTDFALADALPLEAYIAAQRGSGDAAKYMAPELCEQEDYDVRADVYSLAVIVLEMLTGVQYDGGAVSDLTKEVAVPEPVDDVLQRALSEDPVERQEDAGQLGKELREAFAGRSPRETLAYGVKAEDVQEAVKKVKERMAEQAEDDPRDPSAAPPRRETSGITHQLDMGDIEFGSQSLSAAPQPGDEDYEEEILTGPPPTTDDEDEVDGSTQKMKTEHLIARREEAAAAVDEAVEEILTEPAKPVEVAPRVPTLRGVGDVGDEDATMKIDPRTLEEGEDEDEVEEVLLVPPTGPVKSLEDAPAVSGETSSDPRQLPSKADEPSYRVVADELNKKARSTESPANEARAREALQAFDFDASLQAAIDSAVQPGAVEPEIPEGVSDTIPEEHAPAGVPGPPAPAYPATPPPAVAAPAPEDPPPAEVPAQTPPPEVMTELGPLTPTPTGPLQPMATGPVAAEVLHEDAVPAPLSPMPTERVFLSEPLTQKNRTLPLIVALLVFLLLGGTGGAIYYILQLQEKEKALAYKLKQLKSSDTEASDKDKDDDEDEDEDEAKKAAAAKDDDADDDEDEKPAPKKDEQPEPKNDEQPEPKKEEQPAPKPAPKPEPKPAPPPTRVAKPEPAPEPAPKPKTKKKRRKKRKPSTVAEKPKPRKKPKPAPAPKPEPAPAKASSGGDSKCNRGMKFIGTGGGYCIDRYEYPGRGRKPKRGVSMGAARSTCTKRGLRLCTAKEWKIACGGTRAARCNHGGVVAKSGSKRGCRSRYGLYDMSGNVAEWTSGGRALGGDAVTTKGGCGVSGGGGGMTGFRCCGDVGWDMD